MKLTWKKASGLFLLVLWMLGDFQMFLNLHPEALKEIGRMFFITVVSLAYATLTAYLLMSED